MLCPRTKGVNKTMARLDLLPVTSSKEVSATRNRRRSILIGEGAQRSTQSREERTVRRLAPCHPGCHIEKQEPVLLTHPGQKPAGPFEKTRFFAASSKPGIGAFRSFGKRRRFWRLFPLVEKLVERNLERPGKFLESFDGRHGVAVFDPGDVGTNEPCALLDVSLGLVLSFAEYAEAVADEHGRLYRGFLSSILPSALDFFMRSSAITENVSASGFLCNCAASMTKGAPAELFLGGEQERYVARALVVRRESPAAPWERIGSNFEDQG